MIEPGLGFALLWLAGSTLLALPFLPLWREWMHPTDSAPLAVWPDVANDTGHFALAFRQEVAELPGVPPQALPGAWTRGAGPIVIARDLRLEHAVDCARPLYVRGTLEVPAGAVLRATLAEGDIRLGPHSEVSQWIHAEGRLRVGAGSVVLRRATAGRSLRVEPGCTFERLCATTVHFGARGRRPRRAEAGSAPSASYDAIPRAERRTASLHRVAGNCVLPEDAHFTGSLVVTGTLWIGARTTLRGDVKARKGVVVGEQCAIFGAVTSERGVEIRANAFVRGPVVSETDITLGVGVTIGTPEQLTTITAENIVAQEGSRVHGAVWARDVGLVWSDS